MWRARTSYISRRSREARRRKMKLLRSQINQKTHQLHPTSVGVLVLIFPSHHKPSSPLHQKVGSGGKHRGAVAAKPFCARNAAVTGRQESLAVTRRKFPLCRTKSHTAGADSWFGGDDSECRPRSVIYRGGKVGGPFPVPRTV